MATRCPCHVARPALPAARATQRWRQVYAPTRSVVARAALKEALQDITNSQMAKDAISKVVPKLFIDGEFVDAASGRTFEDICPMNEAPIVTVAEAGPDDVERAVQAARRAFDEGPWGTTMSARERGRILYKLADLMEENLEDLAILECLDNGKSFKNCKSNDIPLSIDHFRYMAGWADKIYGSTIPTADGTIAMTLKEPIGVVGSIIPWNFPLLMFAWKVAPALAAGCTVVLKCAEQTPLTALRVADLAARAGLPPGVLNVIPGAGDTGKALCATPGVDKLAFTGSTEVGKMVMSAGAEKIANVSLELGGKSPLIICPDADLETAAQVAHFGQFFNHSQNCAASTRIFVHESIYDEFMKRSVELAESIEIGNPFDENVTQGPQVDQQQFEKYHKYVQLGKEEGAKLYTGEGAAADIGYFVKPVIFGEVTEDMAIFKEEIFGPVMSVIKYSDLDAAIASANNTEYGLAAGVVSQDIDTINRVTRRLKAGTVWVNTYNAQDAAIPFGGYKQSGIDRDKGREGIEKYLETKSIVMKKP